MTASLQKCCDSNPCLPCISILTDPVRKDPLWQEIAEGTADRACADNKAAPNCFHDIAKFKRVVKIETSDANVNGPVRKKGFIDLMKIQDPQGKSRKPMNNGVLTFPFFTIENVDVVDNKHIIVGNDNNLPFSTSRDPNKADDNEFILLEVEALLKAR